PGIAVSSDQGGHVEYYKYMVDLLAERGRPDIKVFGGGGGVIVAPEIADLHDYGISRIYSPNDGQSMGLPGMIHDMLERADRDLGDNLPTDLNGLEAGDHAQLARIISGLELGRLPQNLVDAIHEAAAKRDTVPVIGITGTGGAGKSSLTDEIVRRFRLYSNEPKIAVIAVDPTRRKTKGALLGDRIRMNAIGAGVYMRSLATRDSQSEVPPATPNIIAACKAAGFDLVIVETPGIGQGDAAIVEHVDLSLYVMTPEFGAQSQLEKIDMLDFADVVAINKLDRKGALDALRDVRKQVQRNCEAFGQSPDEMPVFGCMASKFADGGVTALYQELLAQFAAKGLGDFNCSIEPVAARQSEPGQAIVPPERVRYLADVADTVRDYHKTIAEQSRLARERQQLAETKRMLGEGGKGADTADIDALIADRDELIDPRARKLLEIWPTVVESYSGDEYVVKIRDREIRTALKRTTLSGNSVPRVALPRFEDHGELLKWLLRENLPGSFPYTAGVFAFKRDGEDPTRMFAGEGDAFRTNQRFKMLSQHSDAKRLSTAFDSVTLYGFDPAERPDIYGKVGNSGVSIATLDDMKELYSGFDLCDPATSVSMTINGPAPMAMAMFLNTAIDQQVDKFRADNDREPTDEEMEKIAEWVHENVRGTVQADILKEDQGQNTCIFSTEFALRMMA
ncbi:MAG: methylmalonyl-CoA mutase family protein, partial [Rhodospirillaceae bacterium]